MTAYLLLAALAWTVASRGGTSGRDLIVVLGLLVVAMIAGRAWPRRNVALWAAFAALLCWLVADGPLRSGWTLETVRVPLLVVIVALTALLVHRMNSRERDTLVTGLIVVGCLQAVLALAEVTMWAVIEPSVSPRVGALLGSPNGLGMLLVATSVLTAREVDRRGGVAACRGTGAAGVCASGDRQPNGYRGRVDSAGRICRDARRLETGDARGGGPRRRCRGGDLADGDRAAGSA